MIAAAAWALAGAGTVLTPSQSVALALQAAGVECATGRIADAEPSSAAALALLDDELSAAGEHAEALLAEALLVVRPGGLVAVSVRSALHLHAGEPQRGFRSDELARALGHHGIDVALLCAPGAAGLVTGDPQRGFDPAMDRTPGLLDAAPRLLAVGRAARGSAERSHTFFATLPRKVVAAGVLCRDEAGRVLVVHDSFKGHWTVPGGVVDADEDPRSAAVREAWEEAGVKVRAGRVLGVFSASWPDRLVLMYEAWPVDATEADPSPVHAHEIDAAEWVNLDEALDRLVPHVAEQVRLCLSDPGGTLRQGLA